MIIFTSLQVKSHLKDLIVDGRMLLNWRLNRKSVMKLVGIHLAWVRDRWQSLVNTNEPLAITKRERISYLPEQPLASQELSFMEVHFCRR